MFSSGISLPSSATSALAFSLVGSSKCVVSQRPRQVCFAVRCATGNGSLPKLKGPVIVELPLTEIRRPLLRTRTNDPQKVKELMDSIAEIGLQEPIDVLEVEGIFYGFSGCHRFEAHQRLGLPSIRCKVRRGTKETLRHHLR